MRRVLRSAYPSGDVQSKDWVLIDASSDSLGRLASKVALILRGKHKPTYTPSLDMGDFVVLYNVENLKVTGSKMLKKVYYDHSGYPGGLKERLFRHLLQKKPEDIIYRAVKGMLPKGRLGRQCIKKLKFCRGEDYSKYVAQCPLSLDAVFERRKEVCE